MTPRQRLLAAIRHEPVDRLPFAARNIHPFPWGPHAACAEYRPILDAIARTQASIIGAVALFQGEPLPPLHTTHRTEPDGSVVRQDVLETPEGPLRRRTRRPPGQPPMVVEPFIKDRADMRRFLSVRHEPMPFDLAGLGRAAEVGSAGIVWAGYFDPFYTVAELFEEEELIVGLHTDPQPVLEMIEETCQRLERDLRRLLEAMGPGVEGVVFTCAGPELATPPLMAPATMARVVTPFQTRLVRLIHEFGYLAFVHCHGRLRWALPEFIRCGFDATEPCEPPPQGDVPLAELRHMAGGKIALLGYVQDQDLHRVERDDVRRHVAQIVGEARDASGFVAMTTCTPFVFPPTPRYVANYVAFLEAAAELGR